MEGAEPVFVVTGPVAEGSEGVAEGDAGPGVASSFKGISVAVGVNGTVGLAALGWIGALISTGVRVGAARGRL